MRTHCLWDLQEKKVQQVLFFSRSIVHQLEYPSALLKESFPNTTSHTKELYGDAQLQNIFSQCSRTTRISFYTWLMIELKYGVQGYHWLKIQEEALSCGASRRFWNTCLYNYKLNLGILQGNLNNQRFQEQVFEKNCCTSFWSSPAGIMYHLLG